MGRRMAHMTGTDPHDGLAAAAAYVNSAGDSFAGKIPGSATSARAEAFGLLIGAHVSDPNCPTRIHVDCKSLLDAVAAVRNLPEATARQRLDKG